jgi:hypothetical protein
MAGSVPDRSSLVETEYHKMPSDRPRSGPRGPIAYHPAVVLTAASTRVARQLRRLRFGALVTLGALLAHDAVFAAQYGLGAQREAALAITDHGYWPVFTALALLVGGLGLAAAVAAILRLHRALRGLPAVRPPAGAPGYAGELLRLWPRLFLAVTLVFALQENVEHLAAGRGLPGLWVLSWPAYPLALPVLAGVTFLLAAAGAWLRWRTEVLATRLAAARAAVRRRAVVNLAPAGRWRLVAAILAHARILARSDSGRAPPARVGA